LFKKDNLEVPSDKINTIIGKGTTFKGSINGKGLLRIDGEVEGDISNTGDIIVGENGKAKAELKARNITIAGYCEGIVEADGGLELKSSGTSIGTFKTKKLVIEEGAVLSGSTEMPAKDQAAGGQPAGDQPAGPAPQSGQDKKHFKSS